MNLGQAEHLIYKTIPYNSQTYIPRDQEIEIMFKKDMLEQTFSENIKLTTIDKEEYVECELQYRARRLKVIPKKPLNPKERHLVIVKGGEKGIKSIAGDIEPLDYEFTFTTRESLALKKPMIISPTNETKYVKMPDIIIRPYLQDELDYYLLEISRTKNFNKVIWSEKVKNIFKEEVRVPPKLKDPIERLYIRATAVGVDYKEEKLSDVIQIYIKEEESVLPPEKVEPEPTPVEEKSVIKSFPEDEATWVEPGKETYIYLLFDKEIDPKSINRKSLNITKSEI